MFENNVFRTKTQPPLPPHPHTFGGMEPNPATTGLLYQPPDDYECGTIGEMLGRANRSTQRKLAPVPLCLPQIPHDLTQARTRLIVVPCWSAELSDVNQ
jgi:hypothetical protein